MNAAEIARDRELRLLAVRPPCSHGNDPAECRRCKWNPKRAYKVGLAPEGHRKAIVEALRTSGLESFSREDIVVIAFLAHPERFAMSEHEDHPCSAKVYAMLYGTRGLIARGYLVQDGDRFTLAKE